jgi:type I restriction enzyme M protein
MNLSSTIKSIQDIMRKDDGVDGDAQRIGQLAWMLFLKIFDQCEETWENDAADRGNKYKSPLPKECRWRNWAKYQVDDNGKKMPRIQASELIRHVNDKVFPRLQELDADKGPRAKVVREVFQDAHNYMKSGTLMLGVIEKLDEAINFHDMKMRGQLGDIYEQILNDLRGAGNSGEFYTPRTLTDFMVQQVNPSLKKREIVLDPACGTGGFLTSTIAHFQKQFTKKSAAADRKAVAECIRGIEKKQLPHLLCATNMLLHGIEVPSMIERRNTLGKGWKEWRADERVDCVITNPPFGGMEDEGVGSDYPADVRSRETADMFLVLIVKKLMKDKGGRGAVVLPDGTLFGDGIKAKVKELLMRDCQLHTIVRLPKGVFSPYTGIKTNLLFFTKGKPTDTIWFYEHRYPKGVKSYSKTKPLRLQELQPIAKWWGSESDGFANRKENEYAWSIDFKKLKEEAEAKARPHWQRAEDLTAQANDVQTQIRKRRSESKGIDMASVRARTSRHISQLAAKLEPLWKQAKEEQSIGDRLYWPIYNLDRKNPRSPEAEVHDPDKLLAKYRKLLAEIAATEKQLKEELSAALSHGFESKQFTR